MESGACRSGRTGSAPRRETAGDASWAEERERLRGEMREPLCGEERVRRDAEGGMMVEPAPAAAFEVIQAQLVL